jgi:hypothetical protein
MSAHGQMLTGDGVVEAVALRAHRAVDADLAAARAPEPVRGRWDEVALDVVVGDADAGDADPRAPEALRHQAGASVRQGRQLAGLVRCS